MMRPTQLWIVPVLLWLGACALLQPEPPAELNADLRLERGLEALNAGEYRTAFDELAWVYSNCPGHELGARAAVAMAALELDARNRSARAGVGMDLLGRAIREPAFPDWIRPLAESAYLMALSLGSPSAAPAEGVVTAVADTPAARPGVQVTRAADVLPRDPRDQGVHGCGEPLGDERWVAPSLPRLPGPSLVSLLSAAQAQRDSATARVTGLQEELAATRQSLEETERELERIRKTLKP